MNSNNLNQTQIIYDNVQSLFKHLDNIKADKSILNSDILLFVETWSLVGENFDILDFSVFCRLDSIRKVKKRLPRGIICYAKTTLSDKIHVLRSDQIVIDQNKHAEYVFFKFNDIHYFLLYRNNSFPLTEVVNILDQISNDFDILKLVILGDFNIDLKLCSGNELLNSKIFFSA